MFLHVNHFQEVINFDIGILIPYGVSTQNPLNNTLFRSIVSDNLNLKHKF